MAAKLFNLHPAAVLLAGYFRNLLIAPGGVPLILTLGGWLVSLVYFIYRRRSQGLG
jgi:hypothetical protein